MAEPTTERCERVRSALAQIVQKDCVFVGDELRIVFPSRDAAKEAVIEAKFALMALGNKRSL